ncbi:hypothetical protein [Staphylococcus equorum]|uniref:Uncharacterized protein n=1 Tax=Staphylococcus equorum TaxID=246432 RepID=A0A9X4R2M6_9STAP|nr:hypothetical protein [Staphylococcus equorum]MDG0860385.1 hypothetical protein [Staphylococcus equorum]
MKIQIDARNRIMFIKKDIGILESEFSQTVRELQKESGYKIIIIPEDTRLNIV